MTDHSGPFEGHDFDPTEGHKIRRTQLGACLILYPPTFGRFSALGTRLLGDCAIKNELGNRNPKKLFVSFSDDHKWFFLMPVSHLAEKALSCSYNRDSHAQLSFLEVFAPISKFVPEGFREYYDVAITAEKVTIHKVPGYALYTSLARYRTLPIRART